MEDQYLCPEPQCVEKRHELRWLTPYHTTLNVSIKHHVAESDVECALDAILSCNGTGLKYLALACGLSDKIGLKIAELIAVSEDIEECIIPYNNFTGVTLAAIFQALWTNTSLRVLTIYHINFCTYSQSIDHQLVRAMWYNPGINSTFVCKRYEFSEFNNSVELQQRAKKLTEQYGHPPLQFVLYRYLRPATRHTKITRR